MTHAREWPNAAREDRDRSAEDVAHALKEAKQLLYTTNDTERARLLAAQINDLQNALRRLERQGAQTRPN